MTPQQWIESITTQKGLESLVEYVNYRRGDEKACLDGEFTAEQLRAIATFMEQTK